MPIQFEKLSVLVVEDIQPMRKLIRTVLEAMGVGRIYTAPNGEEAFKLFCQVNPDIVISDWEMEPQNGIDLTEIIRRDPNSPNHMVPVIIITGYSALERVKIARDTGVTEFLIKPFTARDIAHRISSVINKPRDFIDAQESYFGPDRRRRSNSQYDGPLRREDEKQKNAANNNTDDVFEIEML